jgi:uncharacterized membrane protein required for colicin V production
VVLGARRGLLLTVIRAFSSVLSLICTYIIYPLVSRLIRSSFIFDMIADHVSGIMGLDTMPNANAGIAATATSSTQPQQIEFINNLNVGAPLKTMLLDNNNSVIYEILKADSISDYVARFISNIIVNVAAGLIVFVITFIIIRLLVKSAKFASSLPVIRQLNRIGGGLAGLAIGIILIWLVFTAMTIFIAQPFFKEMYDNILSSVVGKCLYDNNYILKFIMEGLFK